MEKLNDFTALICARGGSKGLPKKNLCNLGDRSLLGHAISVATETKSVNRVLVSTDSEEIAKEAQSWGAEVPFLRDAELASDTASEWSVWQNMAAWLKLENHKTSGMVILSPTAPLRAVEDVENAILLFNKTRCDGVISVTESHRNPMFNMVNLDSSGNAHLALKPNSQIYRRQDAPVYYDITTVCYVMSLNYILKDNSLLEGKIKCNFVPKERAIDIDTRYDLLIAELLWQKNKLNSDKDK